jgi:hypothetical protein
LERKNNLLGNIIVAGYPRTGTTFLSFMLQEYYGSDVHSGKLQTHSIVDIEFNLDKAIFVTLRNPLDCISSWANFRKLIFHPYIESVQLTLADDINYYLRFYNYIDSLNNKICIVDFDKFTNSPNYIMDKVKQTLNINPIQQIDYEQLKEKMLKLGGQNNLPTYSKDKINSIKFDLIKEDDYNKTIELYNKLLYKC